MALPNAYMLPAMIAGLLLTAILMFRRSASRTLAPVLFRRPAYVIAVVLEFAGLNLMMIVLRRWHLETYFVQALGLVVGLRFIGLQIASGQRRYLGLCLAMCAVSLLGLCLPGATAAGLNVRDLVTACGCALALWVTARPVAWARPVPLSPR